MIIYDEYQSRWQTFTFVKEGKQTTHSFNSLRQEALLLMSMMSMMSMMLLSVLSLCYSILASREIMRG